MSIVNFVIKANGTTAGLTQFIAETLESKLLATITPRLMRGGKYSARFLNVCFTDGHVAIADREDGDFETEHAYEVVGKYLGFQK